MAMERREKRNIYRAAVFQFLLTQPPIGGCYDPHFTDEFIEA